MEEVKKPRNPVFDIFKGVGITLMVAGHTICPFWDFIYMFHMAIFFIQSGVFFKEKHYENGESVLKFIKTRAKSLYIPFVLWNGFLVLMHNFLLKVNIYTSNPDFLTLASGSSFGLKENYTISKFSIMMLQTLCFGHAEQLGGATWFLRVLFFISVASLIGHYLFKKFIKNTSVFEVTRFVIYVAALFIGYFLYKKGFNFYSIGVMFSCAILYYLGLLYGRYQEKINTKFLGFSGSFAVLCVSYHFIAKQTSLVSNMYPNPLWFVVVSFAGFIFVLSISNFLAKFSFTKTVFAYIGQHTISILIFHFAAFKVITYLQVIMYNKPSYCLAAFPVFINTSKWCLPYIAAGVAIPVLAAFLWKTAKEKMSAKN